MIKCVIIIYDNYLNVRRTVRNVFYLYILQLSKIYLICNRICSCCL